MIQRSDEWFNARLGLLSASHGGDIMAKKGTARRENYITKLICERLTGKREESFVSGPMQWGIDTEPLAASAYEAITGNFVRAEGFRYLDSAKLGASPDGLVGDNGGIEIKCPNTTTHFETLLHDKVKTDYIYQMQINMFVWGRAWWDFVSYDPRLPQEMSIKIIRHELDQSIVADLIDAAVEAEDQIIETIKKLKKL